MVTLEMLGYSEEDGELITKSSIVYEFATRNGLDILNFKISDINPEDISGLPYKKERN